MSIKINNPKYYDRAWLLEQLDPAKVSRTYNGKTGCMCGCNGKYSYASTEARVKYAPSYVNDDEDVRPRAVAMACNKIRTFIEQHDDGQLSAFAEGKPFDRPTFYLSDNWVAVEENGRNTTVYFGKEEK